MSRRQFNDILSAIEKADRELDGKLLALFAAEAGFNAHIVTKNHIVNFHPDLSRVSHREVIMDFGSS